MSEADIDDKPAGRRWRRIAVIAGILLAAVVLIAVGIYAMVFAILAPMMG